MALMFQRLARNFIKNGYFPTDADTTGRILAALAPADHPMRILDPCCGEGVALAEAAAYLRNGESTRVAAFGIEYDAERAYHAKSLLDRVLHADLMDSVVQPRSFGLLWLNPPYGDLVADQACASAEKWKGRKRLEKLFYERTAGALQFGGIMVLIVPHYAIDKEFAAWIARHFEQLSIYRAATGQFKQVVIFGVRQRSSSRLDTAARDQLAAVGKGDARAALLPEVWTGTRYAVPPVKGDAPKFFTTRIDARQLGEAFGRRNTVLWGRFEMMFHAGVRPHRPPLRPLSRWHLALALAAGQIGGIVEANDGRRYLVKGDTHKEKDVKVDVQVDAKGNATETRTLTDRFAPVIRVIDVTPGSNTFGEILMIR